MEIEIAGHSGCVIEISNEQDGLFVLKSTHDPVYIDRLKNQAMKQKAFDPPANSNIKAPRVLHVYTDAMCCKIRMEYVYSLHSIAFIENSGLEQIDNFLSNLIDFVGSEIAQSKLKTIDDHILVGKYHAVKDNLLNNKNFSGDSVIRSWFPLLDRIFAANLSIPIPIGRCHGDLTFSNILFSRNSFYLIDFLDSFIETPLLDIVKLRQDTAFNWSGLMYNGTYDQVRHDIVLKFMDRKIVEFFSKYSWYRDSYDIFQLMNFLRILQYAHEPRIVDYLKTTITGLLKNYDS